MMALFDNRADSRKLDARRTGVRSIVVLDPTAFERVYGKELMERVQRAGVQWMAPPMTAADLLEQLHLLRDVEVLFSGWGAPALKDPLLQAAPRLQIAFYAAGSVRSLISAASIARGVRVCSAIDINGEAVADYTVGAVLFALKRGFTHARLAAARGVMTCREDTPGVFGSSVGLVSLGAAGKAVARKLAHFGVRIVAYDPCIRPEELTGLGVTLVNHLEDVFEMADVVSLHTPLLPATVGLVQGKHLAKMRPGATFINTARGSIVREEEMLAVLQERPDITAVLDVTDPEPPRRGSLIYELPNVVLTPHVAGAVGKMECRRMGEAMLAEFERWRDGLPLHHEVACDQLDLRA